MDYRKDNKNNEYRDRGIDRKSVSIKRVSKVTSQGKRLRFSVMVVAGDRNGSVGVALGRGLDTKSAIEKAEKRAVKNMRKIALVGDTIPHELRYKKGAAQVLLRPAKTGSGIIAGSASRVVLELAGVLNVYCKQLGSNDIVANTYCTFEALTKLRNDRVLNRMRNMRARIGVKEKIDADKKEKMKKMAKREKKNNKLNDNKHATRKFAKKTK
ncbi:MAG TPA: 30S ribosomal protein S5 [Candidatus Dojkabacteria bacterium]|nr:30S ribosomal protein S5 [Candidatus Dojkabacteria bacterium]